MKLLLLIILSALVITGCGKPGSIDPVLGTYLTRFQNDAASEGRSYDTHNLIMQFSSLEQPNTINGQLGEIIGECVTGDGNPTINIDADFWYSSSTTDAQHEALVFHELGHCVLGRVHTNALSIMEPFLLSSTVYLANQAYLVQELFQNAGH